MLGSGVSLTLIQKKLIFPSGVVLPTYQAILHRYRHSPNRLQITISLILVSIAGLSYVLFSWSTTYIDVAISSSLFEIWPLITIIFFSYIDRHIKGSRRGQSPQFMTYLLMLLGIPAVFLVIFSAYSNSSSASHSIPIFGIFLAIFAPVLGSLYVFSFLFSNKVIYNSIEKNDYIWKLDKDTEYDPNHLELFINISSAVLGRFITLPLAIILALVESRASFHDLLLPLLGGIITGFLIHSPADIMLRKAHLEAQEREILSLQYISPILAIGWLAIFLGLDIQRIDFLVFGTASIFVLNTLISFDPEVPSFRENMTPLYQSKLQFRYRLKALILSLLLCGMFVYFRKELFPNHDFSWSSGNYWSIVAVGSTTFALLLAFRLTRVETLLLTENERTIQIIRHVQLLPDKLFDRFCKYRSKNQLISVISNLSQSADLPQYRRAYNESYAIIHYISRQIENYKCSESDYKELRSEITKLCIELDSLALGRQHAREFTEKIALYMIGTIVVILCLIVPPEGSVMAQLFSELVAVMLASIIVFLLAHLADISRSRKNPVLTWTSPEWGEEPRDLSVLFATDFASNWRRVISGILIVTIVSCIVLLFSLRHLAGL